MDITAVGSSSLKFVWNDPMCGTRNGELSYRYELRGSGSDFVIEASETDHMSVTIQELVANTEYEFKVAAVSSIGQGDFSSIVRARTSGEDFFCFCYCL